MLKYIIDGNNLIGKIKLLQKLQSSDKQAAREKLGFLIDNYFSKKKFRVSLHFDGYPNLPINMSSAKIIYSMKKTADEKIKDEISSQKNPKNTVVVTSDNNLKEFARVCSCTVISAEKFASFIMEKGEQNEEEERINSINDIEEFKRIFNGKK
ncbi:MAG TPA: NYN domain-containing protein [Ignavibacteriaceae bacterium]|nr:NYN domain-containing protein [Ignavibacteriaceae bacterium]